MRANSAPRRSPRYNFAGAAAAELVASLLALADGVMPATLNHEEPDPECPVAVATAPRPVAKASLLKVGLTDKGQCAAMAVRKVAL